MLGELEKDGCSDADGAELWSSSQIGTIVVPALAGSARAARVNQSLSEVRDGVIALQIDRGDLNYGIPRWVGPPGLDVDAAHGHGKSRRSWSRALLDKFHAARAPHWQCRGPENYSMVPPRFQRRLKCPCIRAEPALEKLSVQGLVPLGTKGRASVRLRAGASISR